MTDRPSRVGKVLRKELMRMISGPKFLDLDGDV